MSKYTKELLEPIVKKSSTIREVLEHLGLKLAGGSYSYISKKIKELNISTEHFTGQGWAKGKTFNKRDIQYYLDNKGPINSSKLRNRLINEGYFDAKCCNCGLGEWLDEEIPLELHHKDNNHHNNNLDNLTILCPNCHTITHRA